MTNIQGLGKQDGMTVKEMEKKDQNGTKKRLGLTEHVNLLLQESRS